MFKTVLHYLANTVDNQDVDIATLYQTAARAGDGKIDVARYSLEQLETIGDRLLTCGTPTEVLQGLD